MVREINYGISPETANVCRMTDEVHIQAVEHLLSAIYASGDTLLSSFIINKPDAPAWDRFSGIGTEIFVHEGDYTKALIFIRQNGASYLRSMSLGDLRSLATKFLTENFWHIKDGEFSRRHDCSYAVQIDQPRKTLLAGALAESTLFNPLDELTLYPLLAVRVEEGFECARFFIVPADGLSSSHMPAGVRSDDLDPTHFPPMASWDGNKRRTVSWLGVRSPLLQVSKKAATAVLGAVALTPLPGQRYLFSGRQIFGGRCTIARGKLTMSGGEQAHTPPMMNDIVLTTADHGWLNRLATLVDAPDDQSRRQMKALEYFYRAWFLNPSERFPWLCMALDSLVGAIGNHTQKAVAFVKHALNHSIDENRLKMLFKVRGAVIHGAAPNVFESTYYEAYYVEYGADPIRDVELIVSKCLRASIFADALAYHAHPNAAMIAEMQAKGRLPQHPNQRLIIPEDI